MTGVALDGAVGRYPGLSSLSPPRRPLNNAGLWVGGFADSVTRSGVRLRFYLGFAPGRGGV
jgi:hypothetical protein